MSEATPAGVGHDVLLADGGSALVRPVRADDAPRIEAGFALERDADPGVVHVRFPIQETPRVEAAREAREHLAEARSVRRCPSAAAPTSPPTTACRTGSMIPRPARS